MIHLHLHLHHPADFSTTFSLVLVVFGFLSFYRGGILWVLPAA